MTLREQRKAAGLTQQQLAHLAECSLSYIALLEHGYTPKSGSAVMPRLRRVLLSTRNEGPTTNRTLVKTVTPPPHDQPTTPT
jgi:predicted transcriptional regulator